MSVTASADHLRQRARHLRDLAVEIERSPVLRLDRYADDDTWRGTRPMLCRATLATNQHQLHAAADELRWHAYGFEQEANALDLLAHMQIDRAG